MMWTRKRVLAAGALSIGGLGSVFAGAAWAPPETTPTTFSGMTLTVDGVEVARFTRCLGLGTKTEVTQITFADEAGRQRVSYQPGTSAPGRIVCERGLSSDITLAAWRDLVVQGDIAAARKNATFVVHDSMGAAAARWNAVNMWPSELTNYFASATGREVVTFVSETTTRVAP